MTDEFVPSTDVPSGRRADREAAILAAAAKEFCVSGFAAAKLDAIAARAVVAKGTIYLYFDTKEDLLKAAVRRLVHPLIADIEREVAEYTGPTEDLLRRAVGHLYRNMVDSEDMRELIRLLMAEGSRIPEMSDFFTREIIARGCSTFRMILWRGVAQGVFRRSPAVEFPELIIAGAKSAAMAVLLLGPAAREADPAYREAHVNFLLDALRVPGA